jgi:phosphohistidine phosphatase
MQIFIMRHGQAEPMASSDAQRSLTAQGVQEASLVGKYLETRKIVFDCVYVSPYLRAQQTAKAVMKSMDISTIYQTLNFITPEDSAREMHDYIDAIASEVSHEHILIISHMPLVSYLVAQLTVDKTMPIFQTAAIAQIDYDVSKMSGALVNIESPEELKLT